MKLLILGSSGFLGNALTKHFQRQQHLTLKTAGISNSNHDLPHYQLNPLKLDVLPILKDYQPDLIINASGSPTISFSFTHPEADRRLNETNTQMLLEGINAASPHTRLLNFSSAAVYGNPLKLPVTETDPTAPLSPYGQHKKNAEDLCRNFFRQYGTASCSIRIFSAYGPGLKKQLFWDLYQKATSAGTTIELNGTGKESRDFIFIDDLINAVEKIIGHAQFNGESINVASGKETLIEEAAELFIKNLFPAKKVVFNQKNRPGDPLNWCANITQLRKLGYEPSIDLKTGLETYANWIKTELSERSAV